MPVAEPNRAITACYYRVHGISAQTLARRHRKHAQITEAIDASRGSNPHVAFRILKEAIHAIAGQPVNRPEMLDARAKHAIEPVCERPNPERMVRVVHQGLH